MRAASRRSPTSSPIDFNLMDADPGSLPTNLTDPPHGASGWRGSSVVLYALMFAAAFTAFMAIAGLGSSLIAPAADNAAAIGATTSHTAGPLPHLLLALVVLIMTCRLLGYVFRRLGQPPVIGEVV